ncbi:YjbF family lipoprotein [Paraglaciecola aquimarina]|uniref:YjbF family lipoprotein n=1 Tax=Paraglaciecola algarum TaxID=3050085 RepID=A0ABS9D6X6_9ALTE|nr:YjbF family lipoprotein [Paraglaciecola sp. G1-23]MCF2948424.1 YjbF family lipoprotein [Paraglaciecola sp. G1-23]
MNHQISILLILALLSLTSCSGTYRAYQQTLKLAFKDTPNVVLSIDEIKQSKVDLALIKRGSRPTSTLALAYLEDRQHKWVSADNVMLIMEKGRIVRTLGLDENLLFLSNTAQDPLKNTPLSMTELSIWSRISDWSGDEYGYVIESKFSFKTEERLEELSLKIDTIKYVEDAKFTAPSRFIQINNTWQNTFWFEKNTGTLIKSIQTLAPSTEPIELVYLSRIARLQTKNAK